MSRRIVVVSFFVLSFTSSARADTAYLEVGELMGLGEPLLHFGLQGEAGVFVPHVPLVLHVGGFHGTGFDVEGGGPISRVEGGLDVRIELGERRAIALLGGVFAGYQTRTWEGQDDPAEHFKGVVWGARTGLDITPMRSLDAWPRNLRFRVLFQMERFPPDTFPTGVELSSGVGYTF